MAKTFKELAEEMRRHAEAKKAADEALAAAVQQVEKEADTRWLDRSIRQVWQERMDADSGERLDKLLDKHQLRRDNERRNDILDGLERLALAKRLLQLASHNIWPGQPIALAPLSRDAVKALDALIKDAKEHLRRLYDR